MEKGIFLWFCFVVSAFFSPSGVCQQGIPLPPNPPVEYQRPKGLQYTNMVYKDGIRSIIFSVSGRDFVKELSDPIIPLGNGWQVSLSFDEMGNEARNYSYTLVHCTHDWQPSSLDVFDYLTGFTRNDITDYRYSFVRTAPYVHYQLKLPNEDMGITKSGNYLVKVYANDSPDDLVLTRRFVVYENKVEMAVSLRPSTATRFFRSHQRLEFSVYLGNEGVSNPVEQVNVSVLQNGRWDNAVIGLKPTFIRSQELVYSPDMLTSFSGGNEFRFVDLRTIKSAGARVSKIVATDDRIDAYVVPDDMNVSGSKRFHLYSTDLNGKYFIGVSDGSYYNRLDADYLATHFSLPCRAPIPDGDLYVFGGLSDWDIRPDCKLSYNGSLGVYEGVVWLKQGFYDYQYAFVGRDSLTGLALKPDIALTEGSYYATENVYYLLVYYRSMDILGYDRVIGFKCVNSGMGTLFDVNYRCD